MLVWFLSFSHRGILADFTGDDMMNLDYYVQHGFAQTAKAVLQTITPFYRPLGGVFYLIFFHVFGLDPLPYRIACFLLLAANLLLCFRLCRLLSQKGEVAWVAVFLWSYHAWFVDLYYSTGTIYELLCVFFYLMAVNTYIKVRSSGGFPRARHWLAIALCYAAALNSKELAATLPLLVGIYELIYHPPASARHSLKWLGRECRVALILGLVTVPYALIKTLSGNLAENPLYRPAISALGFMHGFTIYINPFFYQVDKFRGGTTVLLLSLLLIAALASRLRYMVFGWTFLVITVLPFIFMPHYAVFFFYLPAVGWALTAAGLLAMVRDGILLLVRGRSKYDSDRQGAPGTLVLAILLILLGLFLVPAHLRESRLALSHFMSAQTPISPLIRGLEEVCPAVRSGEPVWFRRDPFPKDTYTLDQSIRLACRWRNVRVSRGGARPEGKVLALTYDGKTVQPDR